MEEVPGAEGHRDLVAPEAARVVLGLPDLVLEVVRDAVRALLHSLPEAPDQADDVVVGARRVVVRPRQDHPGRVGPDVVVLEAEGRRPRLVLRAQVARGRGQGGGLRRLGPGGRQQRPPPETPRVAVGQVHRVRPHELVLAAGAVVVVDVNVQADRIPGLPRRADRRPRQRDLHPVAVLPLRLGEADPRHDPGPSGGAPAGRSRRRRAGGRSGRRKPRRGCRRRPRTPRPSRRATG